MAQHGFDYLHNYIDDLIYTGLPSEITRSYDFLTKLLSDLDLHISKKKLVPPSTSIMCLGIQIDTVKRTISIPSGKLQIKILSNFALVGLARPTLVKKTFLVIYYIYQNVWSPSRYFMNRMRALLRQNIHVSKILLTQPFFQDLT